LAGKYREGVLVKPYERLDAEQIKWLDATSMSLLDDPGIWCFNERAAGLFKQHGATVREEKENNMTCWRISIPSGLVKETVEKAPSRIILGARNPDNKLVLDSEIPRVYFGSGSEANIWLETEFEEFICFREPQNSVIAWNISTSLYAR